MQKYANIVKLEKCCQTHIFLQKFVLIQPRTIPLKICKNFAKICKICSREDDFLVDLEKRCKMSIHTPPLGEKNAGVFVPKKKIFCQSGFWKNHDKLWKITKNYEKLRFRAYPKINAFSRVFLGFFYAFCTLFPGFFRPPSNGSFSRFHEKLENFEKIMINYKKLWKR